MTEYIIAPSILAADIARIGEQVQAVVEAGADLIHIDVMDHHYVPQLTFGPIVVEAIKNYGIDKPLDVHLMVESVDYIIPAFAMAGASYISFHPETSYHVDRTLQSIRDMGCRSGLAFNPATPLDHLEYVIDKVDMVLLMAVNPGLGGQTLIEASLKKIEKARDIIQQSGLDIRLQVDGGIKIDNIERIAKAGADTFVVGSALFASDDYHKTIQSMHMQLARVNR